MDKFERIQRLRDNYESGLDEADRLRDDYHREIVKLHRSGMSLREIAEGLGMSHQRVHQIVSPHEDQPRSRTRRTAYGAAGGMLLLLVAGSLFLLNGSNQRALRWAEPSSSATVTGPCFVPSEDLHLCRQPRWSQGRVVVAIDPRTGEVLASINQSSGGDLSGSTTPTHRVVPRYPFHMT